MTEKVCRNCRHQAPDRSHGNWHECDKTAFWVSPIDDEAGAQIEFGCSLFEEKERGPFFLEPRRGFHPDVHVMGLMARFPGHDERWITDFLGGSQYICDWLNKRWMEKSDD